MVSYWLFRREDFFLCVTLQRTSCCHHSAWHRVYSNPAECINESYYLATLLDMVTSEFVTPIILILCFWLCFVLTSGVGTPTWCCFFLRNTTNPSTTIRWPSFIYSCTFTGHSYRLQGAARMAGVSETWIFSSHIFGFMKIRPVGAVLLHAYWQMDRRDEANSRSL